MRTLNLQVKMKNWMASVMATLLGIASLQGSYVSYYGIAKGQVYEQMGVAVPVAKTSEGAFFEAFATPSSGNSYPGAMITTLEGSNFLSPVGSETNASVLYQAIADTTASLDSSFPNGGFSMMLIGDSDFNQPSLTLPAGSYPVVPQFSNSSEITAVNPTNAITVQWSIQGGIATDFVRVLVLDESRYEMSPLFDSGLPGQTTALAGTATSVVIPAGTFQTDTTNYLSVEYMKIVKNDTSAISGANGVSMRISRTELAVYAKSAGGGETNVTNNIPPVLLRSLPARGAVDIATNYSVQFTFSAAMASSHAIGWSANVAEANMNYSWSADSKTLICNNLAGWPANATITWTLNPIGQTSGFADLNGTPLPSVIFAGSFSTGAGQSNTNCTSSENRTGTYDVMKIAMYEQLGTGAPTLNTTNLPQFMAIVSSNPTNTISSASVKLTDGQTKSLTSLFSTFMLVDENKYQTVEAVDAAYPAGTYQMNLTPTGKVPIAVNLALPANSWPVTPQIVNLGQINPADATKDFVIQWNGFSGAVGNDSLEISISDNNTVIFNAPNECKNIPLSVAATSITIPANTLVNGKTYEGMLRYMRLASIDTNTVPGYSGYGLLEKETTFLINAGTNVVVLPPNPAKIESVTRTGSGGLKILVTADANRKHSIYSSSDLKAWDLLTSTNTTTATFEFNVDSKQAVKQYFRIKSE